MGHAKSFWPSFTQLCGSLDCILQLLQIRNTERHSLEVQLVIGGRRDSLSLPVCLQLRAAKFRRARDNCFAPLRDLMIQRIRRMRSRRRRSAFLYSSVFRLSRVDSHLLQLIFFVLNVVSSANDVTRSRRWRSIIHLESTCLPARSDELDRDCEVKSCRRERGTKLSSEG